MFEALLLKFMKRMPVHQIGRMFKITDNRLWSMMKEYTRLGRADADFSEVRMVGMDETAARRHAVKNIVTPPGWLAGRSADAALSEPVPFEDVLQLQKGSVKPLLWKGRSRGVE